MGQLCGHTACSSLQERCCCGGLTVRGQVGMVSAAAAVGRVLCLLPGSMGHLSNQPQEIRTMGRWVGSHCSFCCQSVSFHCQSDSCVHIPLLV